MDIKYVRIEQFYNGQPTLSYLEDGQYNHV
jgi:hypothetical protein